MIKRIKGFLAETSVEMKKVHYLTRSELISSSWVVVMAAIFAAFFLGTVDIGLSYIIRLLIG
ncbi:MAG: preprotein translocase subunit SecE [Thermodesulfovibrionales bacterium]|nr:preprotein translocase subunit SecE [Thermodesulfovibrionales bacterium]